MSKERYLRRIALAEETGATLGVGSFRPGVILIIGEQASDPKNAPEQRPFCCTKGCSGWLNKLLDIEDIQEEKLFWVNALNNDGSEVYLVKLIKNLLPRRVIALGNVAQSICEKQVICFEKCYHPQYWKRFKSKQRYPLLDMLK